MTIKGILFDLYGTLIDIETDESMDGIYRAIAHYLTYHGVYLHRAEVRERYYQIMKQQREASGEEYAEIDVEAIWNELLLQEGIRFGPARGQLAKVLSQVYRAISRNRLQLYPGTKEVLKTLQANYRLALVTDAQSCYAVPEIRALGLNGYFGTVIISSRYGYRKPDSRLFRKALDHMGLESSEVVCVGNDMFRDTYGAALLGIKTIFVDSSQGAKSFENVTPHCRIPRIEDLLRAIAVMEHTEE
jgi:putative hydrolase of the HAD superfamily